MIAGRIYLDNAAGAPLRPEAAALMSDLHREGIGNPNGGHAEARRARAVLDEARASLAEDFDVEPRAITFTSTASEALALALSSELQRGGTLITSAGEHRGARALAAAHEASGGRVVLLPIDATGRWSATSLEELRSASSADGAPPVTLLSLASGEVGAVQPSLASLDRDDCAAVLDGVQLDGACDVTGDLWFYARGEAFTLGRDGAKQEVTDGELLAGHLPCVDLPGDGAPASLRIEHRESQGVDTGFDEQFGTKSQCVCSARLSGRQGSRLRAARDHPALPIEERPPDGVLGGRRTRLPDIGGNEQPDLTAGRILN